MIDRDLISKLIDADETACRLDFDRYGKKVYRFIFSYVKIAAEAEDITQNVFLKIWENKQKIDINKPFEGYRTPL